MRIARSPFFVALVAAMLVLPACGATQMKMGGAGKSADLVVVHCDKPLGTIALYEGEGTMAAVAQYGLQTPLSVMKVLIPRSNCFKVVSRGGGADMTLRERQLADSGELQRGSKYGKGQIKAADYNMEMYVTFSSSNMGGLGAVGGAVLGPVFGGIMGAIQKKGAGVVLVINDGRTTEQITQGEGISSKFDVGAGALGVFGLAAAGLGGYENTPEGQVIVAAAVDALNDAVRKLGAK